MNIRRIRWFLGLLGITATFAVILFYPLPSILEWQSTFLKQSFFTLILSAVFCLWRILFEIMIMTSII